jgi:hypothetical protein
MNTVLGLPLIKATGMIIDFIDKVVKAKHLDCPPFPIDFRRAMKTVPANVACLMNYVEFKDVQQVWRRPMLILQKCANALRRLHQFLPSVFLNRPRAARRISTIPLTTPPGYLVQNATAAMC